MIAYRKFLLTFDVEDFINPNAIFALRRILEILKSYKLKAIFFITGHMAEILNNFPEIVDMLKYHEIGYHSTSHSVRPTIPEYTDVRSYKKACEISIHRETSHIDPLTGKPSGEGGIYFLQDLFYPKKIQAFRAPGMCWTPPHLEALKSFGIKYDFSSTLTLSEPISYEGITFYPYTFIQQWNGTKHDYTCLFSSILRRKVVVFDSHPTLFVNKVEWDNIYYKGNPSTLSRVPKRSEKEIILLFNKFGIFIKQINLLRKLKLLDTDPNFNTPSKGLAITRDKVNECYNNSIQWCQKRFNYYPKFIRKHFYEFFENCK